MAVRAGYKLTEVGVIPEEWTLDTVSSITPRNMKNGIVDGPFGSNLKTIHYRKSGIPIITSGYVTEGVFQADDYLYVDAEKFKQEKRSTVNPGDIVMAKIGARCGASAILPEWHEVGILSGNALKITVDNSRHSTYYIWQVLWNFYLSGDAESLRTVGAQPAISMANLKKHRILLPPFPEQRTIAAALSDVDALIAGLERLIAKKRDLKQAALQALLTGQVRLPGFSGEWEAKRLGDVFQLLNTANNPRSDLSDTGDMGYIHYGDIHTSPSAFLDCSKATLPLIAKRRVANIPLVEDGDLVMVDASEDHAGMGKCVEVQKTNGREIVAGLHTLLLRGDRALVADGFKGYLQFFVSVRAAMVRLATGISVYGVSKANVRGIEIALPRIDEQTAIAAVLSDMDVEIAALEARRDKTRLVKQGMMQELLTGRVRLIGGEPA